MYKVEITECCLRDGFNSRTEHITETLDDARIFIEQTLDDLGIDPAKFYSRHRSVAKGTMKGVKLFWSPKPGTRHYLFINVYEWVSFATMKPLLSDSDGELDGQLNLFNSEEEE